MREEAPAPARHPATQSDPAEGVVALLRRLGAGEIEHPGGTLLEHVQRVRGQLEGWGARCDLQLAGLCHAFYGTDGFATALLPIQSRSELVRYIGEDAEELVYCYASCDRKSSYGTLASDDALFHDRFTGEAFVPSLQQRRDFAELTVANELDLARISPAFHARWGADLLKLFTGLRPLLSDKAWQEAGNVLD
jgi:hypothetical protein